jgi:PKD repeat protein
MLNIVGNTSSSKRGISEIVLAIISQPSNTTICEGLQASFSVTATGENLTYQWQTDTTGSWANLTDGGDISGATTSTLTIANIEAIDEANYRCIVSDDTDSVISNAASLTVNISAAISSQPTAQSVDEGNTATFSLTATGTGLSYQWQSDASGSWADLTDGGDISGTNTNTLQIANVESADEANYRCIVTGTCNTVTSDEVGLTVNALQSPVADFTVSATEADTSTSIQFTDQSTNEPTSWQWDFGDGNQSTQQNPTHTYTSAGVYTVELTATNADGSDSKQKLNLIWVGDILVVNPGDGNDILANLDTAWNAAVNGDVIQLPSGNFTAQGEIRLGYLNNQIDNAHIRGAGRDKTSIQKDYDPGSKEYMLDFYASSGANVHVEVSHIEWSGPQPNLPGQAGLITDTVRAINASYYNLYLHDCRIKWFTDIPIRIQHEPELDNCIIADNEFLENYCYDDGAGEYIVAEMMVYVASRNSRERIGTQFGSSSCVYIEDNYFETGDEIVDSSYRGKYVLRYNDIRALRTVHTAQMHPAQSDYIGGPDYQPVSSEIGEVYCNEIQPADPAKQLTTVSYIDGMMCIGGKTTFWGNIFHHARRAIFLGTSANWADCYDDAQIPDNWTPPDYPVPFAAGWQSADNYGENHIGSESSAQGNEDAYCFDNKYVNPSDRFETDGGEIYHNVVCAEQEKYLAEHRDYHVKPMAGYTPYTYPHPGRGLAERATLEFTTEETGTLAGSIKVKNGKMTVTYT